MQIETENLHDRETQKVRKRHVQLYTVQYFKDLAGLVCLELVELLY